MQKSIQILLDRFKESSQKKDITKSMQLSLRKCSLIKTKPNIGELINFCIFIFIIQNYFD